MKNESEDLIIELNDFFYTTDKAEAETIRQDAMLLKQDFSRDYLAVALAIILDRIPGADLEDLIN